MEGLPAAYRVLIYFPVRPIARSEREGKQRGSKGSTATYGALSPVALHRAGVPMAAVPRAVGALFTSQVLDRYPKRYQYLVPGTIYCTQGSASDDTRSSKRVAQTDFQV